MNSYTVEFREFAESLLHNHKEELSVKYNNEQPGDDLMQAAYAAHRKMFNDELDGKIGELVAVDNPWEKNELETLKSQYLSKLVLKEK